MEFVVKNAAEHTFTGDYGTLWRVMVRPVFDAQVRQANILGADDGTVIARIAMYGAAQIVSGVGQDNTPVTVRGIDPDKSIPATDPRAKLAILTAYGSLADQVSSLAMELGNQWNAQRGNSSRALESLPSSEQPKPASEPETSTARATDAPAA